MHKAVLQTCFSRSWGGLEMVALELALRMHAEGLSITTACAPGSPLAERLEQAGLKTISVNRKNKYLSLKTICTLRRELKSGKYSAVLVEQLNELWQVVPAMWGIADLKLVGISHTLVGVQKKDWLHGKLYSRVDRLVALTDIHRRNLLTNLPIREQNLVVIPNAVDLRRFNPSLRSEPLRREFLGAEEGVLIGVVSRIDKGKGLLEVLEAAEIIKNQGLAFRLIVVGRETIGEEGMLEVLRNDIARRQLAKHVFLIGHRPDIGAVIASLDLMVMPSPSETFGRVLIEAMASGTAVIASSGGGVADIVHHESDGLLVPPLQAKPLAEAMGRCIGDGELRNKLAVGGLRAARERYDQKKLDRELYALMGLQI